MTQAKLGTELIGPSHQLHVDHEGKEGLEVESQVSGLQLAANIMGQRQINFH